MDIRIVDYNAGNATSVASALEHIGFRSRIITSPAELDGASHIILPGVGSAAATMSALRNQGLLEMLQQRVIDDHVPFLGICIGLQILFEMSEEGECPCLGWLKGRVVKFRGDRLRVPQIGWNTAVRKRDHSIMRGLPDPAHFYFVNSYHIEPTDESVVICETEYGNKFPSLIAHENIVAAQFHIEKSGPLGLTLLRNFLEG